MTIALLITAYIALAAVLVYLSDKLGKYIDLLDRKTKLSGAFLGGVLLAAVTSLPELFTSLSATLLIHQNDLVVGNILGSNLFNLLIIGICLIFFYRAFQKSSIEYRSHDFTFLGLALIYGLFAYGLFAPTIYQPAVGPINFICPISLIIYIVIIYFQPREDVVEEENTDDKNSLTIKQIIIRFSICALFLVGISVVITFVTDRLGKELNLSATVSGALFLAVATSLAELVSCISLCRRNNYNAAFGDILGSCLFNFSIISLCEFLSWDSSVIPQSNFDAKLMLILAVIIIALIFVLLLVKRFVYDKKEPKNEKFNWFSALTIFISLISVAGYIIFLIL